MQSKAYQRFDSRLSALADDLQLADLLLLRFRTTADTETSICQALGGDILKYPGIHTRRNNKTSRAIVANHLKHTLYVSFIKELYEDFSEYLATSLSRAALAGVDAARFAGEVKLDLNAAEILKTGSWDGVVRLISDKISRAMENERSTISLIEKLSARVGLQLERDVLNAAMPYLDARHILVHRDGKVDEFYTNKYPQIATADGRIALVFDVIREARRM